MIDTLNIRQTDKVLFIYPHPDDETFFNAALIQRLIKNGTDIFILCLTKGGASTLTHSLKSKEQLKQARTLEFESVMKYLKVTNYQIFDLPDGQLLQNQQQTYDLIKRKIAELSPNTIITYEPSGIYGHPDHILVSEIVTQLTKTLNKRLIYSTVAIDYKSSENSLKMATDITKVQPLAPNSGLKLTVAEYLSKLNALRLYKSQVSLKHEFRHKLYGLYKMVYEYYVA